MSFYFTNSFFRFILLIDWLFNSLLHCYYQRCLTRESGRVHNTWLIMSTAHYEWTRRHDSDSNRPTNVLLVFKHRHAVSFGNKYGNANAESCFYIIMTRVMLKNQYYLIIWSISPYILLLKSACVLLLRFVHHIVLHIYGLNNIFWTKNIKDHSLLIITLFCLNKQF